MDIPKILAFIRPGEEWKMEGTDYTGLKWLSATPKPTLAEVQAGDVVISKQDYLDQRARAYPPLVQMAHAAIVGGKELTDMQAVVAAVDIRFPAPAIASQLGQ